jgi:hypothetical protein
MRPDPELTVQNTTQRMTQALRDLAQTGLPEQTITAVRTQARARMERTDHMTEKIARQTILNLHTAYEADRYFAILDSISAAQINKLLAVIAQTPFVTTATTQPENHK